MSVAFPWILLLAVAAAAFALRRRTEADDWRRVMHPQVLAMLRPRGGDRRRLDHALVAATLGLAALSQPALVGPPAEAFRYREAWILLVDTSKSMELGDVRPSRMEAARSLSAAIVDAAGARPVALALFAGDAFLAEPFAFDTAQLKASLSAASPGVVPVQGSDVARAIAFSASLKAEAGIDRARLFLVTDGSGEISGAARVAEAFRDHGGRLDAILVGGEGPSPEPSVRTDAEGLAAIAAAGGGRLLRADALGQIDHAALDLDEPYVSALDVLAGYDMGRALRPLAPFVLISAIPFALAMFRRRA